MTETTQKEFTCPKKYQTHLKRILHDYKNSSKIGLNGPGAYDKSDIKKRHTSSPDLNSNRSPSPIPPIYYLKGDDDITNKPISIESPFYFPPDCSRIKKKETVLEGESISCFDIGGEMRLCMPHVIQFVLKGVGINEIIEGVQRLSIHLPICSTDQLESLKSCGRNDLRLPLETMQCGLITRTDAERLCDILLKPQEDTPSTTPDPGNSFKVYHECFGKVLGIFKPNKYKSPSSRCIDCIECNQSFSTCEFVRHSHNTSTNSMSTICHWGFDSDKWRDYLLLARKQEFKERAQLYLDTVKRKFNKHNSQSSNTSESVKREHDSDTDIDDIETEDVLNMKRRRNTLSSYSKTLLNQTSSFTAYQPWNNNSQHPLNLKYSLKQSIEDSPLLEPARTVTNGNRLESNYTPNVTLARPSLNKLVKPIPTKVTHDINEIIENSMKIEDLNSSSGASSMSSTDSNEMIKHKDIQELSISVPRRYNSHHHHHHNNNNNNNNNNKNNDNEKIQALRIANASLQKQLDMALQKSHEGDLKRADIVRQHHADNQQLRAEFHHSLIAIDTRWRNLFREQNISQYMEQIRQAQIMDEKKVKT